MQANTNNDTFCLFINDLIKNLDLDRPGWREDTIFQLDGARWHKAPKVKEFLQRMDLKVVISAPYSWDGATVELFYAMLKKGDLILHKLGTGKSKLNLLFNCLSEFFVNIVQMVKDKIQTMRRSHLVMLWHQTVLRWYYYVDLQKV